MYTNHRHYILLIFAIVTTVVVISVYVILRMTIISQAAESSQTLVEEAAATERKQYEQELVNAYANSTEARSRIASFIVSQEKIVNFIKSIEGIGDSTGVKVEVSALDSGTFVPDDPKNPIGNLKAHVEIQGEWTAVMRSLVLLENIPYSIALNNIRLVKMGDNSAFTTDKKTVKTNVWNLSVDVKTLITK